MRPHTCPDELAAILRDTADAWAEICATFVQWHFSDSARQRLLYSPVDCNELTQMGTLLRALERARPQLPKLCETTVTRKKATARNAGDPRADLWFSYDNYHCTSTEVYLEAKLATATFSSTSPTGYSWPKSPPKHGIPDSHLTPAQLAAYAESQLRNIDFRNYAIVLDRKLVVALFVRFQIPISHEPSRDIWTEKINACLEDTEAKWSHDKPLVWSDFDAGNDWRRLRDSASLWDKGAKTFCPRARLYLYEISDDTARKAG